MPGPVSITWTLSRGPAFSSRQPVFTTTRPLSVNFTALERKFSSTCLRRVTSPSISSGLLGSSSSRNSIPFAAAWIASRPAASSRSWRKEKA